MVLESACNPSPAGEVGGLRLRDWSHANELRTCVLQDRIARI